MNGCARHGRFTGIIFAQENAYLVGAMMQGFQVNNPFARKKPNTKRKEPRRTVEERLHGQAKTDRRREIFERSGGFCEGTVIIEQWCQDPYRAPVLLRSEVRCNKPITWESMHWSHKRHSANKSDSLEGGLATCKECHLIETHNPKPCRRRPGKPMNIKEAQNYWRGKVCFCEGPKKPAESLCPDCLPKVSEQTRYTLQHASNPDDYRQALAQAEMEILQWKPEGA